MSSPPESPLSRAQASEVLRYWLASLQLDEALSMRPRARRAASGPFAPRVAAPVAGQDYFKLALEPGLLDLLNQRNGLRKPFDAELGAFFETWLVDQYRRGKDDRDLTHLLVFPVVHLPRGELAGLLRYAVRVRFNYSSGAAFVAPSYAERRRKQFPEPAQEIQLNAAPRGGQKWPFFVDTRLLNQQLGVTRESIDELFEALRAEPELSEARMLELVCERLEREAGEAAPPSAAGTDVLARLTAATSRLLARHAGRARVYPVAIVIDGTRAKTTWYLQRELQALLEERGGAALDPGTPLGAYLAGRAAVSGRDSQRTLFPGPTLSPSQRQAAERAWGSTLAAVQGPPGTGKTTLIVHMAGEALVRQVEALRDRGEMGRAAFVVTSTNNRAVDNVIDPLNARSGLPLALRAGSQRVCEQVLAPQLEAAGAWLERVRTQPAAQREAALEATLQGFDAARAELNQLLHEYTESCQLLRERDLLRCELDELRALGDAGEPALEQPALRAIEACANKLKRRLLHMRKQCEVATFTKLKAVDREWIACAKRELPELLDAVRSMHPNYALELPPPLPATTDIAQLTAAWDEGLEHAVEQLEALQDDLTRAYGRANHLKRVQKLQLRLDELPLGEPAVRPECEALERALFECALAAREAWAAVHADVLSKLIQRTLACVRGEFSLRALWNDDDKDWNALRQLFGIWGCTLLSLGNCFPVQLGGVEQCVIDEAGQCHPAYAVSALLRARRALVIGDVHQLEPVIDLEPADDERVVQACKLELPLAMLAPYRVSSESRSSVQALADRAVSERLHLSEHFRCQPEIIAISDALCRYGLQVLTPLEGPAVPLPFLPKPVSLIDVSGEQERLGGSWYNAAELALTFELLATLLHAGVAPDDIAIITPYRAQLEQLQKQLASKGIPIDQSVELSELELPHTRASGGVALGTVHRFQGGERSIVIFSSVVTRRVSLGFLDQRENLLNVAVSRARHRFIAVGHRALLASGRRTALITGAASPLAAADFQRAY